MSGRLPRSRTPSQARRLGVSPALALAIALAGLLPASLAGGPLTAPSLLADDCPSPVAGDAAIIGGNVVFVGTVIALSNGDRWATVRVEERWKGADGLEATVSVHGGPPAGRTTDVDRTYELARYLFVVNPAPGYYFDDVCTGTQPWRSSLALLRPPGVAPAADAVPVETPVEPQLSIDIPVPLAALVGAAFIAVFSYLLILRGRRRPPDWQR